METIDVKGSCGKRSEKVNPVVWNEGRLRRVRLVAREVGSGELGFAAGIAVSNRGYNTGNRGQRPRLSG